MVVRIRLYAHPAKTTLLVLLGFMLGAALFTPWDKLWTRAITSFDQRAPDLALSFERMDHAGPLGFQLHNLSAVVAGTPVSVQKARISVGFNPRVSLRLDTGGPEFFIDIDADGTVRFNGAISLTALLVHGGIQGDVRAEGELTFPPGAGGPQGAISLLSADLLLPSGLRLRGLTLDAGVTPTTLDIRTLTTTEPIKLSAAGTVELDEERFLDSTYTVSGKVLREDGEEFFTHAGRVDRYFLPND